MAKTQYPRMALLKTLYELTEPVTPLRFITTRPPATGTPMPAFLLLRLPQAIRDRGDTYQRTCGQIAAFARDTGAALENTAALEAMQQAILDLFPIATPLFHAKAPLLLPGGADGAGFHYITVQFDITIFKQPQN